MAANWTNATHDMQFALLMSGVWVPDDLMFTTAVQKAGGGALIVIFFLR